MKKQRRISSAVQMPRGLTLLELLVVVAIIGILSLISLPNIYQIIQMNRIRTSANDLLIKVRYARSLAIKTQRELTMTVNLPQESLSIFKPGHTEYNLLADIAGRILSNQALDDRHLLYVEKSGKICVSTWNNARVSSESCEYYIGDSRKNNGVDEVTSTCPNNQIVFEASGVLRDATCSFQIKNQRLDRSFTVVVYKGGQVVLK